MTPISVGATRVSAAGRVAQGKIDSPVNFGFDVGRMRGSEALMMLTSSDWRERARAHRERLRHHTVAARWRRDRGIPHPIEDFLFTYYAFPFSLVESWWPGTGVGLEWQDETPPGRPFDDGRHVVHDGVLRADPSRMTVKELARLTHMLELLEATQARPPHFGCHGLHEWAMVYRGHSVRHEGTLPLRLPQNEIDRLVESRPVCCSHYDAFRFFAADARPLNRLQPTLEARPDLEQPGCIHANMDLYKWCAKAMPWTGSDLLADCFELAIELRRIDMRASPYDVSAYGLAAIAIETPEGRREYEDAQRRLAAAAAPLRQRLIDQLRRSVEAPAAHAIA